MFENVINFFKNLGKKEDKKQTQSESSKDAAKERLHLVLMQDRANVSADFLELMKQEIIDVIKKYIEVDEKEIDVRLTNKENEDGTKQYVIEANGDTDLRKVIFSEFAKENITIFEMKKADITLEDAFMQLIEGGEK